MNIHDLREAQVHFESQMDTFLKNKKDLYNLRDSFTKFYDKRRIKNMTLNQYAIGNNLPKTGYNFCYTLERSLDGLGRIIGATSSKFGIYYGKTKGDDTIKYRFTKKFGSSVNGAFINIKQAIIDLIELGEQSDLEGIEANPLSPMFKGKILSTYFPDRYLNLFSDFHLEYFLVQLNLDNEDLIWSDAVYKREALLGFKLKDEIMKDWPLDIFTDFLYNVYPGKPIPEGEERPKDDILKDYRTPNFPSLISPKWISLEIKPGKNLSHSKKRMISIENPDYELEARKLKKIGDRGEKIVLDMERKRLTDLGFPKLASKVEKAKFDYLGYDIHSFESNGKPRHIEVKSTTSKVGDANFFLSSNELKEAMKLENYYIYMVYDITSKTPKIWIIENPFNPENENVIKEPVSYRVKIHTS
ncbi:DUF3883 domain-containing protein [Algoriphagus marincola]|uniref:DUF3883 domain-containing protein n=1 Tax=Algoriphagus marincola TaxID=264027 RepID=UPI0003F94C90|nr:DUF3883 domain-containing protein [Algoriphagus marincola]